jgi:hypothetical protein
MKPAYAEGCRAEARLRDGGRADRVVGPAALGVVEENLAAAVALGFGTENVPGLIRTLEKETGVEVKARRVRRSTETEQSD